MSEKQILARNKKMYGLMVRRFGPKYWKSGRRQGVLRDPGRTLPFTAADLHSFVMRKVGEKAVPCPFCDVSIDALNLSLDHDVPTSLGGSIGLDNFVVCCQKCNRAKGQLTGNEFSELLLFIRINLSQAAHDDILLRLGTGAMGMRLRYYGRKK
jgi:5-methylcytosine-specific restriction endonuclease McrA